jgi:ABC-type lipoprotein release transport system permease subunit
VLARSLVAVLASRAPEILYSVPWGQIGVTATLAAAGSAISISLAAWQAGRVSPSDALRH